MWKRSGHGSIQSSHHAGPASEQDILGVIVMPGLSILGDHHGFIRGDGSSGVTSIHRGPCILHSGDVHPNASTFNMEQVERSIAAKIAEGLKGATR